MATNKIQMTKDYRQFTRDDENRPTNEKKHKKLFESMEEYGFLKCFPIVVRRRGNLLVVKDGQHRLMFAESLGLPVCWVEEEVDFDIAVINSTAKVWVPRDYAEKHSANGIAAYTHGLEFADRHGLPIGTAFSLLAGTTTFNNVQADFYAGRFTIKDRDWADAVAGVYGPLVVMSAALKTARFIEACMAVCRVKDFDARRLINSASKRRESLVPYSTRDAYLEMIETIYNYGKKQLVPLKNQAIMAMRERNVGTKKRAAELAAV